METAKKFSAAMPHEEQTLEWFSRYKRVETSVADFECSERPSTGSIEKTWRKFEKSTRNIVEVPFGDVWQVRLPVRSIAANSWGGHQHVIDVCKVCLSVASYRA
jgi:hypothetical protein